MAKTSIDFENLTSKEAGDLLGVTAAAVYQWVKAGCPFIAAKGQSNRFRWRDVHRWWLDHRYRPSNVAPPAGSGGPALTRSEADARKAAAEAQLAELKLERERGRLVPLDEVEDEWARQVVAVRARLLALPARLRGPLGPESAAVVDREIRAALAELAVGAKVEAA